jgi:hypothetical protein
MCLRAGSSSATDQQACAYFLTADFNVAQHTRITNSDTVEIIQEYVSEVFAASEKYLDSRIKGMHLITFSMPMTISSLGNRGVVLGCYVSWLLIWPPSIQLRQLLIRIDRLTTYWAQSNWGTLWARSLQTWPLLKCCVQDVFFCDGSLEGVDP